MTRRCFALGCCLIAIVGCENSPPNSVTLPVDESFLDARGKHRPKPVSRPADQYAIKQPPPKLFGIVKYKSPIGILQAYLTPDPKDGKKHPAIIWITGGDCNSIGDVWSQADTDNDQSASQYRKAGIVMMYPSLRGGNQNPGKRESFFGEVDDVLAARQRLSELPYVDPERIYLGGHSTGGTLVLLVAETGAKFRAVFSFGPVYDLSRYGADFCHFDFANAEAVRVRSPIHWLRDIACPTLVIEGSIRGNLDSLEMLNAKCKNDMMKCYRIDRGNHFDILAPINTVLAQAILKDTGRDCNITLPTTPLGRLLPEELKK